MHASLLLRTALGILIATLALSSLALAQTQELILWANQMPEPRVPADPPEKVEKGADGTSRRSNISRPRLVVYRPSGVTTKVGMIVVPGGGFGRLADEHEGTQACEWLAKHGVTAFLLLHRTPTTTHMDPSTGPVQDLQKGVMEVRRRAGEFGLDPAKIGVLGFSAGGQVTLIAATNPPKFDPAARPGAARPDFLLAIYPWRIYDAERKALRSDIRPDAGLPPTFIAQMGDDPSSLAQGSTLLYLELVNRKVPAELHIYEKGGHGFGMRSRPGATGPTDWSARALDWLRLHGWASSG